MACAILKPGPPQTIRQLNEAAGYESYDCLQDGRPKPGCRKAGKCLCCDRVVDDELRCAGVDVPTFLCGEGVAACACGYFAEYLCDFPMGGGKTCDAPLCEDCARHPGPIVHPLDEITARRLPEEDKRRKRLKQQVDDMHFCLPHWALSHPR